ncbi:MAG: hypothetical protein CMK59_01145 [Proteobacteria bacterium]|nr:hypothetical protein [Pseudomonadota bacterium]
MKRIKRHLKKILSGKKPPAPKIKSRPQPQSLPQWMQQDIKTTTPKKITPESSLPKKHHNPNVYSFFILASLTKCKGSPEHQPPPTHPFSKLLKINGVHSFFFNKDTLMVTKHPLKDWESILPQVSSIVQLVNNSQIN